MTTTSSCRLSDYATADEINAAIAALGNLWRQHGSRMHLCVKGDKTYNWLKAYRRYINYLIRVLRYDAVPTKNLVVPPTDECAAYAIIAPFVARYDAAVAEKTISKPPLMRLSARQTLAGQRLRTLLNSSNC